MSTNKGILKIVSKIINDNCTDCPNKCGICEIGVCEDVVREIGCFFLFVAEKEQEKEDQEEQ